jgi:hypothetical protein
MDDKNTKYFWPSIERKEIKLKVQPTASDKILHDIEFMLEGHYIRLRAEQNKTEERVVVFIDDELHLTLTDDRADVKKVIELFNHKILIHLRIRNKMGNWVLDEIWGLIAMPVEGLYVAIDGKPLQGSLADPGMRVETAIYGYYFLGGFLLMSAFEVKDSFYVYSVAAIVACLFVLPAKRYPTIFMIIGLVWGILELRDYVTILSENSSGEVNSTVSLMRGFLLCIRIGIILNFVRGLIGVIKINFIKYGKLIKMA